MRDEPVSPVETGMGSSPTPTSPAPKGERVLAWTETSEGEDAPVNRTRSDPTRSPPSGIGTPRERSSATASVTMR